MINFSTNFQVGIVKSTVEFFNIPLPYELKTIFHVNYLNWKWVHHFQVSTVKL